ESETDPRRSAAQFEEVTAAVVAFADAKSSADAHPLSRGHGGAREGTPPVHRIRLHESDRPREDEPRSAVRRSVGTVVTHVPLDAGLRPDGQSSRAVCRTVRLARG